MPKGALIGSTISNPLTGEIIEEIPAPAFKYLALEGGGIRGVAYGGAADILENAGILKEIEHVSGTSVGAIAAMLLAIGYGAAEAESILKDFPFNDLLEGKKPWPFTPNFITKMKQGFSIFFHNGFSVSSGQCLLNWLEDKVDKKEGKKELTFADLARLVEADKSGKHRYKYLSVVATNLSNDCVEIFNHKTTPAMPIVEAVRRSTSVPGVFKAVEVKNDDTVEVYVDGGIKNNLPADIFNQSRYLKWGYGFTKRGVNPHTLCFKIDTGEEIIRGWEKHRPKSIKNFKEFSKAIFMSMLTKDDVLHQLYGTNIISIYDGDISTLKFDVTESERKKLVKLGKQATLDYLQSHLKEAYKVRYFKDEWAWVFAKNEIEIKEIVKIYHAQLQDVSISKELKFQLTEKNKLA